MDIRIITEPISRDIAREVAKEFYGTMVKGAVDIEQERVALGGEWHIDANNKLIKEGSNQENVWGFNFYPEDGKIEYSSLINIRPAQGNRRNEVQSEEVRKKMESIIRKLIP